MNKNNYIDRQRIQYFDVARGIGIVLIIIGHFSVKPINKFIYSFHIPLFFICSGYFFTPCKLIGDYAKKKARQLLIPYYFTSLCVVAGAFLKEFVISQSLPKGLHIAGQWLLASLYASGNNEPFGIMRIGAIWFLWSLFVSQIILQIAYKTRHSGLLVTVLSFIGLYSGNDIWFPLSIQPALTCLMFISIGYEIKKNNWIQINDLRIYVLFLFTWVIDIIICDTNVAKNYYSHYYLNISGAIAGSFFIIKLCEYFEKRRWMPHIRRWLELLGKNSLIAMCFHLVELNLIDWNKVYNYIMGFGVSRIATYCMCFVAKLSYLCFCIIIVRHVRWLSIIFSTNRIPHTQS